MKMVRKNNSKGKGFKNWGKTCVKYGKEEDGEREEFGKEIWRKSGKENKLKILYLECV